MTTRILGLSEAALAPVNKKASKRVKRMG